MSTIKTTIIALAAVVLAGVAAPAFADTAPAAGATGAAPQTYAFVDMARIMHESNAAKAVNSELATKKASLSAEFDKKGAALNEEGKKLGQQRTTLSKEEFETKARALEDKFSEAKKSIGERKDSFDYVASKAMAGVRKLAGDSVVEIAQEHKYAAVFSREAVIIGDTHFDITDEVIKRMNAGGQKVAIDWSAKPKKAAASDGGDGQ